MRVLPTKLQVEGVPNYYDLYVKWLNRALNTSSHQSNACLTEAYRLARIAEEFGQATIEEDTTLDDLMTFQQKH